jgi:hypothetical protein
VKKPKQSLDDAAKQEMVDALEELLAQQDFQLSIPYNRLNQAVADVVSKQGKVISSLQSKIVKGLQRELTVGDNSLESLRTTILTGLNAHQADIEYLLTQLASKADMIGVGDTLEAAILSEAAHGPELGQLGTLVLQVGAAEKWLERIADALERIADALESAYPPAEEAATNAAAISPNALVAQKKAPAVTWSET